MLICENRATVAVPLLACVGSPLFPCVLCLYSVPVCKLYSQYLEYLSSILYFFSLLGQPSLPVPSLFDQEFFQLRFVVPRFLSRFTDGALHRVCHISHDQSLTRVLTMMACHAGHQQCTSPCTNDLKVSAIHPMSRTEVHVPSLWLHC